MRELTDNERFSQMITVQAQRDWFRTVNTSTMPDWEYANGEWVKVYPIRYDSTGAPNRWMI